MLRELMKTGYAVGDCMTIQPITISKDCSLSECAKVMKERHVGSLLIVEHGKLVGLVTEQDLVRKAMAENRDPLTTHVKDILVTELLTVSPEKDVYEAMKMMRDYNIRHLPVMDKDKLVGFLTLKDILKIQPQLFELIVEKIELREESRKPIYIPNEGICEECGNYSAELETVEGAQLCPHCRTVEEE